MNVHSTATNPIKINPASRQAEYTPSADLRAITIRLPANLYALIQRDATRYHRSMNKQVVFLLKQLLKNPSIFSETE